MRTFNWVQDFTEKSIAEDIPESVQKLERYHWIYTAFFGLTLFIGFFFLILPPIAVKFLGLFLALQSTVMLATERLYIHIRLSTYRMIWDNKNRTEMELRKSEAQDL